MERLVEAIVRGPFQPAFGPQKGEGVVENFWRTTAVVSPVQTAVFRYGAIKSPRALAEAR